MASEDEQSSPEHLPTHLQLLTGLELQGEASCG